VGKRNTFYGGTIYTKNQEVLYLKSIVMFKQTITYIILVSLWISSGFTGEKGEKWKAYLELEGKGKSILLEADAIYGGYYPNEKKFFFFGKDHAFESKNNLNLAKIFTDLCITNGSSMFEFELNNIKDISENQLAKGNISFKKKKQIESYIFIKKNGEKEVVLKDNFKNLGFELTEEADKVMTGKFTLTFKSIK